MLKIKKDEMFLPNLALMTGPSFILSWTIYLSFVSEVRAL